MTVTLQVSMAFFSSFPLNTKMIHFFSQDEKLFKQTIVKLQGKNESEKWTYIFNAHFTPFMPVRSISSHAIGLETL